jgi:type II restriction enzyme
MIFQFDTRLAERYTSTSQKIRVMSEFWIIDNIYCINCGALKINAQPNNNKAWDFICPNCKAEYELKSKKNTLGVKINDGAYKSMIEKIDSHTQPNFFFLNYSENYHIKNVLLIPKHFFTPDIIEIRKPLSEWARRAWRIGCNILFSKLPETGKIYIVRNGQFESKRKTREQRQKWLFLNEEKNKKSKWWILDTMNCVDKIADTTFSIDQVYAFEAKLKTKYPKNKFIKDKLRQQLQILRDKWIIEFLGWGQYKKI